MKYLLQFIAEMGRHKEWRKLVKKLRRKRIRTEKAKYRDKKLAEEEEKRALSPSYQSWILEEQRLEKFKEEEEKRIREEVHNRWLKESALAEERWKEQQKRLEWIKEEKLKQEMLIREEWEQEQKKLKDEEEKRALEKERKEQERLEMLGCIDKYISGECDELPAVLIVGSQTNPDAIECPFFSKVAACRFKDSCSRNHIRPGISKTLLLPGFYSHFRFEQMHKSEYDTDVSLEFDEKEIYQHFMEFYNDVLGELKSYGQVVQFKVCANEEAHLRGNVYVQYTSKRSAMKAYKDLQGRYYGGKQISVEFCNVPSWRTAICGLFRRKTCPKGPRCNFLHVFENPRNEFSKADNDTYEDIMPRRPGHKSSERNDWAWSPSSERVRRSRSRDSFDEVRHNQRRTNNSHRSERRRRKSRSNSADDDSRRKRKMRRKKRSRDRSRSSKRSSRRSRTHNSDS